jgi:DNA invertase Pin-like site-specific DNA recombinase
MSNSKRINKHQKERIIELFNTIPDNSMKNIGELTKTTKSQVARVLNNYLKKKHNLLIKKTAI